MRGGTAGTEGVVATAADGRRREHRDARGDSALSAGGGSVAPAGAPDGDTADAEGVVATATNALQRERRDAHGDSALSAGS
ncbi:hypothetical protein SHJG_6089 [Streptomyces hygroscopicus subsp. jinggangensis 5008]|nr:hypothetical protein SHJG_6089 [Streptomyces hygroscopicus subsp. jinggangensis 5008]AGF65514.1 hypothetical protein SHJGH_5851 [Streptomyces hygroscopicus subsp. jinggangensis TL01]